MSSKFHPNFFGLNVRRTGPQPRIFVRSFSPITSSDIMRLLLANKLMPQFYQHACTLVCIRTTNSATESTLKKVSLPGKQAHAAKVDQCHATLW
jgi:hypothetical protein